VISQVSRNGCVELNRQGEKMKERTMKNLLNKFTLLSFAVLLFISLAPAQIREGGDLQGNVTDTEGVPLPGVTVTIESPNLIGGVHSSVTDVNGYYRFRFLTVGTYKITAQVSGFNKVIREGIEVHSTITLTVDIKMTQETLEKEIVVLAATPTVDVKNSKSATVIMTDNLLTSIPSGKSFEAIMNMSPGVDFYSAYGSGYASPNRYQLDGIDLTDPLWGGIWFPMDYNTIKEVTVQGLGLPAEFGHFTGVMMTAVTKSGSNRLSTMIEFRYNGQNWNSNNREKIPASEFYDPAMKDEKFSTPEYFDLSGNLGGKIIQDKLWFFVSAQYDQRREFPLGTPAVRKFWTPRFFGKLTYQLNASNRLNAEVNRFNDRGEHVLAGVWYPPDVDLSNFMPGWLASLSWTSTLSPTTFLDAKVGYNKTREAQLPSNGMDLPGHYDYGTGLYSVNYPQYSENNWRSLNVNFNLSHYVPELIKGSHDFKAGTEFIYHKVVTSSGFAGGESYNDLFGQPYIKAVYAGSLWDHYPMLFDIYVQDQWSVTKKLTLNIGFRYDHYWFKIPAPNRGTVYNNWNISPRVGLTLDPLGDRKNVFKFHYGHYYETLQRNQMWDFETRDSPYYEYQWNGTAWDEISRWLPSSNDIQTQSNLSHPWTREIIVGYERELFRDASLSITFYNRTIGKAFTIYNAAAKYNLVTVTNPGPDGIRGTGDKGDGDPFQVYDDVTTETSEVLLNPKKGNPPWFPDDLKWYARGVEFIFNKRFSHRWQMIASYNYTRSRGNSDGAMGNIYSPNQFINAYGDRGGYYAQPHQFKIQGNVILPLDISIGAYVQIMSGPNLTPFFGASLPHGYVWQILAEAPGITKGPTRKTVDLKVEKIFRVKGFQLHAMLDVFNVLNEYEGLWERNSQYGPYYNKLYGVMDPRTFRVGFRIIY